MKAQVVVRQCPCDIPLIMKEHARLNPTNNHGIMMCFEHARMHDDGRAFDLWTERNR